MFQWPKAILHVHVYIPFFLCGFTFLLTTVASMEIGTFTFSVRDSRKQIAVYKKITGK